MTEKPENKYKYGSIIWSVMNGDWGDMTASEIAEVLGTSEAVFKAAVYRIRRETGYTVRCADMRLEEKQVSGETFPDKLRGIRERSGFSSMTKPKNEYKHGTLIWSVMDGDWEDLTVSEIAEVLDVKKEAVQNSIRRIRRETGYTVRYVGMDPEPEEETVSGETFPDRLRRMRRWRRVSLQTLEELCGLSHNMIFNYEKRGVVPGLNSLMELADYFDVSIDYLVGRTDNPQRLL